VLKNKCLSVFRYTRTVAIFHEHKLWNMWTDIQKWKAGGCYPMVWRGNVSLPFWANIRRPPLRRLSSSARGLGPWTAWSAARNKQIKSVLYFNRHSYLWGYDDLEGLLWLSQGTNYTRNGKIQNGKAEPLQSLMLQIKGMLNLT